MVRKATNPFSTDTFLTVLGILVGASALLFEQWAVKAPTALFAIGLIVYAGRRHGSHPLIRYPVALAAIAVFAFLPWDDIWADFHKNHPAAAWLEFVTWQSFHWALALAATVALLWNWRPVWRARRRAIFSWRMTLLGEETWISRESALKVIRASRWAQLKEPSANFFEQIGRIGGGFTDYDRSMILFSRYIDLALEQFELHNPQAVRETDGKKEYAEGRLRAVIDGALDTDAIKQFGDISI
jgi:hypothetical protein